MSFVLGEKEYSGEVVWGFDGDFVLSLWFSQSACVGFEGWRGVVDDA